MFEEESENSIGKNILKELEKEPNRDMKEFKEIVNQLIREFRELSISTYLAEGMNLIDKAFEKNEEAINNYFIKHKETDANSVKISNMPKILDDVFEILSIRLLCLDNLLPKDDSGIITEAEEKEYKEVIQKLAESMKIEEVNAGNLKNFIHLYLKSGSAKYSFASVPKFDENEGIDPYADMGDVAPGEKAVAKKSDSPDNIGEIEKQIQQAGENGEIEKEVLLKRIKQYLQLKEFSQNVSENESINLMIEKTQKEIETLEEEKNKEEDEGEYENDGEGEDFAQYHSQQNDSKFSKMAETVEEIREKALHEIFTHYAKSQMLIGRKATFEQIQHEISNLNLGEYMKFCKDFKIP